MVYANDITYRNIEKIKELGVAMSNSIWLNSDGEDVTSMCVYADGVTCCNIERTKALEEEIVRLRTTIDTLMKAGGNNER